MEKKTYLNRQPVIGDLVEAIREPLRFGDWIKGYEYTVVKLAHGYVKVTNDRLPQGKEILIADNAYKIIKYEEIPEPKETHVKIYKFLGIPFLKRTTYIYD